MSEVLTGIETHPSTGKEQPFRLEFGNGKIADAIELMAEVIQVHRSTDLSIALSEIGLSGSRPILVLVGGASGISSEDMARLNLLFVKVLAPLAESLGAAVVDGGTDTGIMQLMGKARAATGTNFPLIGVAPSGKVAVSHPERPSEGTALEPNHTHFVIVPGAFWGDECPWMADLASLLADGKPSVTVLINGGKVTWRDAWESVRAGRPVLVIAGTGRTADEIASAIRGESPKKGLEAILPGDMSDQAPGGKAKHLVASGLVSAVDLTEDDDALVTVIRGMLSGETKED
ncbi:MAG TPA: hypothetical protein VK211_12030 [Kamptonema sp.]|nr:hypothetical protein [Kamptonema sp.]